MRVQLGRACRQLRYRRWHLSISVHNAKERYISKTVERYRIAVLVHDVGKIGVPEAVLCKAGRLDDSEFEIIKRHPKIGHRILKDIPGLADVLPGVLLHHEKWDGTASANDERGTPCK